MDADEKVDRFTIRSLSRSSLNGEMKERLGDLLQGDQTIVSRFCDLYFERFFLIHKVGHIILHKYDPDHHVHSANTEYLANLLAFKYFQMKKEDSYLKTLVGMVDGLLDKYKAHFDFDIDRMNALYPKYRMDVRTHGAFHFNSLKRCLTDHVDFQGALHRASKGRLKELNKGVILRKDLGGIDLVNECVESVFELNDDVPEVKMATCADLSADSLDILLS